MAPSFFLRGVSSFALTTALLTGLAACAVGPDFERPKAPDTHEYDSTALPPQTTAADDPGGVPQKFINGQDISSSWWQVFHSDALDHLILQAIKANPDLAAAQATLREAREQAASADSLLLPQVTGDFNGEREKITGASAGGDFPGSVFNLYNATVSVSYGLDIWGGARRQIEEANAAVDYQRFEMEATYLMLTGNVVTTAVQEASVRGQIAATRQILEQEDKEIKVTQTQLQLGAINKSPVLALMATREQTRATLPPLEKQLSQIRHQLSVLAGQLPSIAPEGEFTLANLHLPTDLPVTIPSNLVEQRPDVRAAEANLHAASAGIGVAISNRLPQISLSADVGSQTNSLSKLFSPGTGIWSFGFDAAEVLFDAGSLAHQQGAAEAAFDAAAAQYRKTVLMAFQQVADTLHALQADADTLQVLVEAHRVAAESLSVTRQQYQAGSAGYLDVLNAELTEQQTKLALVQAKAQRFADTAALFQALGGGWWNRPADVINVDKMEGDQQDVAASEVTPQASHNFNNTTPSQPAVAEEGDQQ